MDGYVTWVVVPYKFQSMGQHPLLHLGILAIEKEAFGSPSTTVANLCVKYLY